MWRRGASWAASRDGGTEQAWGAGDLIDEHGAPRRIDPGFPYQFADRITQTVGYSGLL
jgi:hypothetical protein